MKLKFLIFITIFFNIKLFAQTTSPFTSVTGIGELNDLGYSNNVAMGGVGISNGSVWHLNNQNNRSKWQRKFKLYWFWCTDCERWKMDFFFWF